MRYVTRFKVKIKFLREKETIVHLWINPDVTLIE